MAEFEKGVVPKVLNGTGLKILIVHTRWNLSIVDPLVKGTIETLHSAGVPPSNILVRDVPGAFELPFASQQLLKQNPDINACISIGVLIKGSTMHFEYIADATCQGLMRVGLDLGRPVVLGVLTCLTEDQAFERAGIGRQGHAGHNHGIDWAQAAVEMALLNKK
ncbi:6,7-dimethyl-8-ribityllumazine synthase [Fimicolochytrium jonesii]|uniref:6,7-dimethyl-8-ribityllumazine synthase n=1 Tax=Fimicolochytrium jonesii TaxID=1396493 RepID=UPI0022FDE430|nr:6,7-dimethyl-8-ribityllumazine synthase [Fimicolochytrium jonesii]KAI8819398.1 6,7-dimethyl-8-ribityllumazine synthase [Fimicolochytrium jonesii]